MATSGYTIRFAQSVGIVGAAWLSGNIAAISLISVPAVHKAAKTSKDSSSQIATHWSGLFHYGATRAPPITATVGLSFAYLAWRLRGVGGSSAKLYGLAGCLTVGIIPFTLLIMNSTNQTLLSKAAKVEGGEKLDDQEVSMLVGRWTVMNTFRSTLPLMGAVVGLMAVLG